jgi:hypothetical protein
LLPTKSNNAQPWESVVPIPVAGVAVPAPVTEKCTWTFCTGRSLLVKAAATRMLSSVWATGGPDRTTVGGGGGMNCTVWVAVRVSPGVSDGVVAVTV